VSVVRGRLNPYGLVVLSAGIVSFLLSVFRMATGFGLPYHFGYVAGQVNLTIVNGTVDTLIWIVALLIFSVYPIVSKERALIVLLVHGAIPFSILVLLLNPETFPLLAANNILAFLIALVRSQQTFKIPRSQAVSLVLSVLFLTIIPIEVLATFSIVSDPAAVLKLYETGSRGLLAPGRLSLGLFYVGDITAGILLTLLMFSPIILFAASQRIHGTLGVLDGESPSHERAVFGGWVTLLLLVGVGGVAAFTAVLPYLFHQVPMGVDSAWYLEKSAGHDSPLNLALEEPRAAYVLILLALRSAFQLAPVNALELGAAFLSVLCVVGTFFFTWQAFRRTDVALFSALLASFSPQLLIGTFAGIFEAWLVYSESLFFFGLILHSIRNSNSKSAAGAVVLSLLIILTHAWTWLVLMLILVGQLVILMIQSKSSARPQPMKDFSPELKILLMSAAIGGVGFTLGSRVLPALEIARNSSFALFVSGLRSPTFFFGDVSLTLTSYVGGFYSNWILLCLAVLGVFAVSYSTREVKALVASWILVPGLLSVFLSAELQWRLVYLLPYSFLAAIAIFFTLAELRARTMTGSDSYFGSLLFHLLEWSCVAAISLVLWNNALRSMVFISASF